MIRALFDYASQQVFPAGNPSAAERLALVAVGGYGRGTLAPASDVDLLFLFPYKQTPWSESVTEYVLYMLWDLGLKVGHATRTVSETIKAARDDLTVRTAVLEARLVTGDDVLFSELQTRFAKEIQAGTAREFIAAKLAERDGRHARSGASVTLSSRRSRKARVDSAICKPCSGSPNTITGWIPTRLWSTPGCFPAPNTGCFGAATISCGRCAAICTSWPVAPRSASPSICSRNWRAGWATSATPARKLPSVS
jgi:hypothetical protein